MFSLWEELLSLNFSVSNASTTGSLQKLSLRGTKCMSVANTEVVSHSTTNQEKEIDNIHSSTAAVRILIGQ